MRRAHALTLTGRLRTTIVNAPSASCETNLRSLTGQHTKVLLTTWIFVVLVLVIPAAHAATGARKSCIPGRTGSGYYTDGWFRDISGLIDTNAYITEYSPYVAYDGTAAWVMLWNNSTPALYAQVGWAKSYNGSRYKFVEYSDTTSGTTSTRHLFPSAPLGSSTFYEVYWDVTYQRLDYIVNGTIIDTSPRVFTMRRGEQFGEIHSPGNQMPGGASTHVAFSNAQIVSSTQAYNFDGVVWNSSPAWFGNSKPSASRDEIWDTACFS